MKVIAFNGSPRKEKWNTITLLNNALEGSASMGADTELIHLYDLIFSGCISCFACKKLICSECLLTCDLSGELVCPRHSTIKDGVVIGNHAKKGLLWRLKVRRIAEDKEFGIDVRKQLQHK